MKRAFHGLGAMLYKEFIAMFRDRTSLFFLFFPPLAQIIMFGFALDMDVKNVPLVVYDEDGTAESRALVERFVNTGSFRFAGHVHSAEAVAEAMRRGRAGAGLQILPDYAETLQAGRPTQVQVVVDGSSSTIALQCLQTALLTGFRQSAELLMAGSGRHTLPVEVRPQVLFNPEMRSPNFYVPGVIGLALQVSTVLATAFSMVRERERGTMEQLLVSPLGSWGLMLGKILPYFAVTSTMALALAGIMRWVFDIRIAGPPGLLLIGAFFYLFTLLSLGLLISIRAENQMQALQISMTTILPTVFFSGFLFPRDNLPDIFYAIGTLIPATYFIELMRGVVLRGAGAAEAAPNLLVLALMGTTLFSFCALRFRRRLLT